MKRTDWIRRPYHLLLLTAIVLFLISLFYRDGMIDIHLHDTYYVFAIWIILQQAAVFLSLLWLIYLITFRWFNRYLTRMHLITTFLCIGLSVTYKYWLPSLVINDYIPEAGNARSLLEVFDEHMMRLQAFALFTIAGQLFFVANICYAITKFASRPAQVK